MASILACDTLAPDFMQRVTPDQNLTLSDPVSRAQRKVGMSVDGSDAAPDCAMAHPVVNQGAACTLAGICGSPSVISA